MKKLANNCLIVLLGLLPVGGASGQAFDQLAEFFKASDTQTQTGVRIVKNREELHGLIPETAVLVREPAFEKEAVLVVSGQYLGSFCRQTRIDHVKMLHGAKLLVVLEERVPEICQAGYLCPCALVGAPPPLGNMNFVLAVPRPVLEAKAVSKNVIDRCCIKVK